MKTIAIVIPVHNRKEKTINCLRQLKTIEKDGFNTRIIVVDDGSQDGTYEAVNAEFPEVALLRGDGNLWWAGAINEGVHYALRSEADYILTINDDIRFDRDFLKILYEAVENSPFTIAGSLIIFEGEKENEEQYYAGCLIKGFLRGINGVILKKHDLQGKEYLEADVLPGRSLLLPKAVFETIGFFDSKKFPQGNGDFDFTGRARKAGFRVIVCIKSRVYTTLNRNLFPIFLLESSRKEFLKSLLNPRYAHNIKNTYYSSFMLKPFSVGVIELLVRTMRLLKWIILKLLLPRKKLKELILKVTPNTLFHRPLSSEQ